MPSHYGHGKKKAGKKMAAKKRKKTNRSK